MPNKLLLFVAMYTIRPKNSQKCSRLYLLLFPQRLDRITEVCLSNLDKFSLKCKNGVRVSVS